MIKGVFGHGQADLDLKKKNFLKAKIFIKNVNIKNTRRARFLETLL